MIELQSCIMGLNITGLKNFGIQMKWLNVETAEGKGKFELIKIIRIAFEDEASKCDGEGFTNLVVKIKSLLHEQTLDESNESSKETEKKKQELLELETQYEKLSMAQEELKQKMQLLELAQKQPNSSNKQTAKPEAKTSPGSEVVPSSFNTSIFRRELKIQGQIGEPGQKDKLTYQSLISQIDAGLKKGYTETEVATAVIRSIQAGLQLRSYLEGLSGLTLPKLRKILRFHFQEKSATELYQLLANISQLPKEDPQSFLIRALTIRQKIVFASQESDSKIKYDGELVQGLFLHAVETGLADETIRAKIRPLLKNTSVADEDLIEAMSLAMSAESERANKFSQGRPTRPSTKVSKVDVGSSSESKETNQSNPQDNQILATLKAIRSELNSVQSEVASLQRKVDDKSVPLNHAPTDEAEVNGATRNDTMFRPRNPFPRRCQSCVANNQVDCSHCFKCGGLNHMARYCRSGNGRRLPPRDRE